MIHTHMRKQIMVVNIGDCYWGVYVFSFWICFCYNMVCISYFNLFKVPFFLRRAGPKKKKKNEKEEEEIWDAFSYYSD